MKQSHPVSTSSVEIDRVVVIIQMGIDELEQRGGKGNATDQYARHSLRCKVRGARSWKQPMF